MDRQNGTHDGEPAPAPAPHQAPKLDLPGQNRQGPNKQRPDTPSPDTLGPDKQGPDTPGASTLRQDPPAQAPGRRAVIYPVLVSGLVIFAMGQSILFAVLGPLARKLGLSELHVGALVSVTALVIGLASPWWGRFGDRSGRRLVMVLGLVAYSVSMVLFSLAILAGLNGLVGAGLAFAGMVGARLLYALLSAGIQPTAAAYVADTTSGAERTAGLALVSGAFAVGMVVGPVFGAGLSYFGLVTPLFAVSGLALVSAFAMARVLPGPAPRAHAVDEEAAGFWSWQAAPYLFLMFGVLMVGSAAQQTAAFYLQDVFRLSEAQTVRAVGLTMAASALAMILTQGLFVQLVRPKPATMVRLGFAAAIATFLLLVLGRSWPMILAGYCGLGLAMGLLYPGLMAAASFSVGERDQGRIAGLMGSATSAGVVVGPIMGTGLYPLDPTLPFAVSAVVVMVLFLISLQLHFFTPGQRPRSRGARAKALRRLRVVRSGRRRRQDRAPGPSQVSMEHSVGEPVVSEPVASEQARSEKAPADQSPRTRDPKQREPNHDDA